MTRNEQKPKPHPFVFLVGLSLSLWDSSYESIHCLGCGKDIEAVTREKAPLYPPPWAEVITVNEFNAWTRGYEIWKRRPVEQRAGDDGKKIPSSV